jgi:putative spermidine/putrescine transport system substrate-binding protein
MRCTTDTFQLPSTEPAAYTVVRSAGCLARQTCSSIAAAILALNLLVVTVGFNGAAFAQPSPPEATDETDTRPHNEPVEVIEAEKSDTTETDPPAADPDVAKETDDSDAGATAVEADRKDSPAATVSETADEPQQGPESVTPAADAASETAQPDANGQSAGGPGTEADQPAQSSDPSNEQAEVNDRADSTVQAEEVKLLKIATWSGAFGQAQKSVVIDRFSEQNSVEVAVVVRDGKDPLDLSKGSRDGGLDAAEFSALEVIEGCKSGALVKLSSDEIGAPGDFLEGSILPCGVGSFAWSHVFAANRDAFQKRKPKSIADVFDTKRFPGKRALIKAPKFLLEAALLADGAKLDEIYDLLATEKGRARAFGKLDAIKDDIIWVSSSSQAMDAFNSGEAVIAQTFSGRAFFDAAHGHAVDIIWDGQIYAMTYWAIPAGSARPKLAQDFVRFAVEPQQLAGVAQRFPYGPTRTAALALSKRHLTAGVDLEPYLSTAPANMENALALDEVWWRDNDEIIETEFAEWLQPKPADEKAQ